MPINMDQHDDGFRPLNGFLFKCDFLVDDRIVTNLSPEIITLLTYSVSRITLPKFKESELKPHSFGSFFIPFPYFSSGEKDMTIEFYETDDMLISKVFYSFLNRYRWKSSTMFDVAQADLSVEVTIYDQRNLFGRANDIPLLRKVYYLKTKEIEPPQFARDGSDTDLCRLTVTFNTIETPYRNSLIGGFGDIYEINKQYDSEKEKYVDVEDDVAFTNTSDMSKKIFQLFETLQVAKPTQVVKGVYKSKYQSEDIKEFVEGLDPDPDARLSALSANNNQQVQNLRQLMMAAGIDVTSRSAIANALVDMGVLSTIPVGWCQRGVSLIDQIARNSDTRVVANSASRSQEAWENVGYELTLTEEVTSKTEIDNKLQDMIDTGKFDKNQSYIVIIDYDNHSRTGKFDSNSEEAGHVVLIEWDEENNSWGAWSDRKQVSLSGLDFNHKVTKIRVMQKSEELMKKEKLAVRGSTGK